MVKASPTHHRVGRLASRGAKRRSAPLGLRLGALVFLASTTAVAAPPPDANPALAPWFRSLTNPVILGESCCSEADGHILSDNDWRETNDGYQVRVADAWWQVPPDTVLNNVPNPTGSAVVFWEAHGKGSHKAPRIYCFVRPPES